MTIPIFLSSFARYAAARCTFAMVAVVLVQTVASAPLIDFETIPSGAASSDDFVLLPTSSYNFGSLQISFGIDSNADNVLEPVVIEQAGTTGTEGTNIGFQGSTGTDTADPGFAGQLGQYFLRSSNPGSDFGKFTITYTGGTVTAASGEIWDIDGTGEPGSSQPALTEQYTVKAYDSSSNLLATQVSPLGTLQTPYAPLDGRPWVFSFSGLTAGISRIEVDFTGTKPGGGGVMGGGIGLAFNNFYPTTAIPEPSSLLIWLAITGVGLRRASRCD
jgi:hypothetical protein